MKCLRCGKEIGNNNECSCGHFYENNLDNNKNYKPKYDKYGNIIQKNKKKKENITFFKIIISILIVIYIIIPLIVTIIKNISVYYDKGYDNPVRGVPTNDYCSFLCENEDFTIEGDYCKCIDGREYSFH